MGPMYPDDHQHINPQTDTPSGSDGNRVPAEPKTKIRKYDRFGFAPSAENLDEMADRVLADLPLLFPAGGTIVLCLFKELGRSKSQQACASNLLIDLGN